MSLPRRGTGNTSGQQPGRSPTSRRDSHHFTQSAPSSPPGGRLLSIEQLYYLDRSVNGISGATSSDRPPSPNDPIEEEDESELDPAMFTKREFEIDGFIRCDSPKESVCPICRQDYGTEDGDIKVEHCIRIAICEHEFGSECFSRWINPTDRRYTTGAGQRNACPMCNTLLFSIPEDNRDHGPISDPEFADGSLLNRALRAQDAGVMSRPSRSHVVPDYELEVYRAQVEVYRAQQAQDAGVMSRPSRSRVARDYEPEGYRAIPPWDQQAMNRARATNRDILGNLIEQQARQEREQDERARREAAEEPLDDPIEAEGLRIERQSRDWVEARDRREREEEIQSRQRSERSYQADDRITRDRRERGPWAV